MRAIGDLHKGLPGLALPRPEGALGAKLCRHSHHCFRHCPAHSHRHTLLAAQFQNPLRLLQTCFSISHSPGERPKLKNASIWESSHETDRQKEEVDEPRSMERYWNNLGPPISEEDPRSGIQGGGLETFESR